MTERKERKAFLPEDIKVDALFIVRGRKRKSFFVFEDQKFEIPARKSVVVVQNAQGEISAIPWRRSFENQIGGVIAEMSIDEVNRLTPPAFKEEVQRALARAPKIPLEPISSK